MACSVVCVGRGQRSLETVGQYLQECSIISELNIHKWFVSSQSHVLLSQEPAQSNITWRFYSCVARVHVITFILLFGWV